MMNLLLALMCLSGAQETATNPAASSGEDLQKSFQREYVYLTSQKETLTRQKNQLSQNFSQKIAAAKSATQVLQKDMVRLAAANDENHEYMMNLERRKKDLQKRGSSLESTYKKMDKILGEYEAGLHFSLPEGKIELVLPENIEFADFDKPIDKTFELLTASSQIESFPGTFLGLDGKLLEGSITRVGRSAAIGTVGDTNYALGPNGEGLLKALEVSEAPKGGSFSLYVFESLHKIAKVKKTAGFTEKLADLSPILFLAMMLLLVAGLFTALIKV